MKRLPHMTVDPGRPGVILFDGDPLTGMLAGMRAADIARACNSAQQLAEALEAVEWSADYVGERSHGQGGLCPTCQGREIAAAPQKAGHRPDCKLSLALKAFRGETP